MKTDIRIPGLYAYSDEHTLNALSNPQIRRIFIQLNINGYNHCTAYELIHVKGHYDRSQRDEQTKRNAN